MWKAWKCGKWQSTRPLVAGLCSRVADPHPPVTHTRPFRIPAPSPFPFPTRPATGKIFNLQSTVGSNNLRVQTSRSTDIARRIAPVAWWAVAMLTSTVVGLPTTARP